MPPPEEKKEDGNSGPAKTPVQIILDEMAKDCKRIISRVERKAYKQKLQEIENDKKKQAEEAKLKADALQAEA